MKETIYAIIITILLSFFVSLILGYLLIPALRRLKAGQQIREDGPQSHLKKAGTPTMGGIIMMVGTLISCAVMNRGNAPYIWFCVISSIAMGLIGMWDDMIIVVKKRSLGLKPWQKILMLIIVSGLVSYYAYRDPEIGSSIYIPFANIYWDMGIWYIPFTMFVIIAVVNSVNLTDGLDGLASGVTIVNSATYTLIFLGLTSSAFVYPSYMAVFAAAITGACLAFLRFNSYPAKVFMGDTGSFFLGGALVMMSIVSRLHLFIILMGLMFVLSSVSCILQVGSYKLRKKRIFKMAPLHHHFELKGASETKIVSVYMIITVITCLISLYILY